MPLPEYSETLLRKAEQDAVAARKLAGEPDIADEIVGFHAQQAVEELMKAVLTAHGIDYRRTHDLVELIDLLRDEGIGFPDDLEDVRELNPFAAVLRYADPTDLPEARFDRQWALERMQATRTWAEAAVADAPND